MGEEIHVCHCCSIAQVPEKGQLCGQCEAESYEQDAMDSGSEIEC